MTSPGDSSSVLDTLLWEDGSTDQLRCRRLEGAGPHQLHALAQAASCLVVPSQPDFPAHWDPGPGLSSEVLAFFLVYVPCPLVLLPTCFGGSVFRPDWGGHQPAQPPFSLYKPAPGRFYWGSMG